MERSDHPGAPEVKLPRSVRLVLTFVPIVATVAIVGVLYVAWPWPRVAALLGAALAVFFYLGKFTILAPVFGDAVPFTVWELAALVSYMDVCVACLVAANLGALYRVPWVGGQLEGLERYGKYSLARRPAMRRLAKLSVALFVVFPIAGTGAIGASILGRLLGVNIWWIVGCIAVGAVFGSFAMAATADVLGAALGGVKDELWFKLVGIGLIVGLVAYFAWRAHRITSGKVAIPGTEAVERDGDADRAGGA